MINDTSFWYLVSFIIFVAIFLRPVIRLITVLIAAETTENFAQRLKDAANFEAEQIKKLIHTEAMIAGLPKEVQKFNSQTDNKINAYQAKSVQDIDAYKTHSLKLLDQSIKSVNIECHRQGQESELNTLTSLITSKLRNQVTPDIDSQIRHHLVDAFRV